MTCMDDRVDDLLLWSFNINCVYHSSLPMRERYESIIIYQT